MCSLLTHKSTAFAVALLFPVLLFCACQSDKKKKSSEQKNNVQTARATKDPLSQVIALDTLSAEAYKQNIMKSDPLYGLTEQTDQAYVHYFKARKFLLERKQDSAIAAYQMMKGKTPNDDVELLKTYSLLSQSFGDGLLVESSLMKKILDAMATAEKQDSRIKYRFYDLLAKAYFQNNNDQKSLKYVDLYFKDHPYAKHPVVKQRYYDISFLLASRLGDFNKMNLYNGKARDLAFKIGDSLAIARTYDNESQIYARQNQNKKALEASRVYFRYLQKNNNLNDIAYNNLATSFIRNKELDSAIKYYKEGLILESKNRYKKQKEFYYSGLKEAYILKGDFASAMEAADSAYSIELRNVKAIEAEKVAEMHEQYETEKKDLSIVELSKRNKLNETYIKQQQWTLLLLSIVFVCLLAFFFIILRQQRLKVKNTLLAAQNQRLVIEQKMLQAQLNPHFIFNAIANLQSLIASGHVDEPVCYLNSFSSLLRGVLEQNRKDFIELNEEINLLTDYIRLQQMRYEGVFDYELVVDENLKLDHTLIPPMLVQPFVENAVEHGFRNISYKGLLKISFERGDGKMVIRIEDNGSGLSELDETKQKKQSLAHIILKERLILLFTSGHQEANFTVTDKKLDGGQGVVAKIIIPLIEE